MNLISIVLKPKTKTVNKESIFKVHNPNDTNIGQIFLTSSLRVKFIYPRAIREQRSHMFPVYIQASAATPSATVESHGS